MITTKIYKSKLTKNLLQKRFFNNFNKYTAPYLLNSYKITPPLPVPEHIPRPPYVNNQNYNYPSVSCNKQIESLTDSEIK